MRYSIKREEEAFITVDGQKLYTIQDLILWLNNCSEDNFRYHVNEKVNHFLDWIRNSLKLDSLAERIKEITKREEMIKILEDFIYEKEANKKSIIEEI